MGAFRSLGTAEDVKEPVLLEDVAATDAFIKAAEVVVIGFFQVCRDSLGAVKCTLVSAILTKPQFFLYKSDRQHK